MNDPVRIGVVGATSQPTHWAACAHLPVLEASPDFELIGVCTTRMESAEESARVFGAKLAFDDHRKMVASPEIEAISVVVRVPSHFEPTMEAIKAGKPVYTEWPLGVSTDQAKQMADGAEANHVITAVGLQARALPAYHFLKDLIDAGSLGEVLSCHAVAKQSGALGRTLERSPMRDASLGMNTLTIASGHMLDTITYLLGDFSTINATVRTQVKQLVTTDTNEILETDAPDTVFVTGQMSSGALVSSDVSRVPFCNDGFRIEIYGTKATLIASGNHNPQLSSDLLLQIAEGSNTLVDLPIPEHYIVLPSTMPTGEPYGVANLYHEFAQSIRSGNGNHPTFATAVKLHELLDGIRVSSSTGATVTL